MPPYRKYNKYKRRYKKYGRPYRRYYKGMRKYGSTAPPAARGFYGPLAVSRMGEKKVLDAVSGTTITANDGITASANPSMATQGLLLNGVAKGDDYFQRIGRTVQWKSFYIRGTIVPAVIGPTSTYSNPQNVRILVFWDLQANGVAPLTTDVLDVGAGTINTHSNLNLSNRERFRVLWDKVYSIGGYYGATITYSAGPWAQKIKLFKKFKIPVNQIYNDGITGSIGNITTNALWLLVVGDDQLVVAPAKSNPIVFIHTRGRFTDL